MVINYIKMGLRIRTAREKKRMTQEKLAELIDVSNNYISNIERSQSIPSLAILVKICEVLDVTPDYLLMDSIYVSTAYVHSEIAEKLKHCTPKSIHMISKLITLIIEEQDR